MRRIVSFPFTGTYCVGIFWSEFLLYVSKGLERLLIGLVIFWYCYMILLVCNSGLTIMCEELISVGGLFTHYLFISYFFIFFLFCVGSLREVGFFFIKKMEVSQDIDTAPN